MTYSEDKKKAIMAAYKSDFDHIKKEIEETHKKAQKLNKRAREIWERAHRGIHEKMEHFERIYEFVGSYPIEEFQKKEGEISRAWGELKNAFDRGLAGIHGEPTEEEDQKMKKEHHSLLDI